MKHLFLFLPLFATAFAAQAADPHAETIETLSAHEAESYLRVHQSTNDVHTLEIAWRSFKAADGDGPTLWLGGVSHLGTTNYYAQIQEQLNRADLVLYEGVNDAQADGGAKPFADESKRDEGIQALLADMLGLVFQLNHIDYSPEHFEHCDMDMASLMREISGEGAAAPNETQAAFDQLSASMSGADSSTQLLEIVGVLVKAMPKMQSVVKLLLVETLGHLPSDLSQIQGLPPEMMNLMEILLNRRNEIVLARIDTLKTELKPSQTATIFYGAAHNIHLEQELVKQGYVQQEEVWYPAISLSLQETGLSIEQVQFFRQVIQTQMSR